MSRTRFGGICVAIGLILLLPTSSEASGTGTILENLRMQLEAAQAKLLLLTKPEATEMTGALLNLWRDRQADSTDTSTNTQTTTTTRTTFRTPTCDQFVATPTTITSGMFSMLSWDTTGASAVTISNGIGSVAVDGLTFIRPSVTTVYTLTAKNAMDQSTQCTVTITVESNTAPTCTRFDAEPSTIARGGAATLTWDTSGATKVKINNRVGTVPVDGTLSVSPRRTTTYTLTAEGAGGKKVTCAKTVTVKPTVSTPNLSFCAHTLKTKSGTLCAIRPSSVDSRTLDVSPNTGPNNTRLPEDDQYGFGYHVFAVPNSQIRAKGVWVHLGGSYGRPYDQQAGTAGVDGDAYSDALWLDELMAEGYTVLQLAYDNRFSVNGDLCGKNDPGFNRNNCSGEVREVTLSGTGNSPYRTTNTYNSIDHRLKTLVGFIEDTNGIALPDTISANNIDWSKLDLSGHSQGATQSYYIAKQRAVNSVCILSGGYDGGDGVNPAGSPDVADWMLRDGSATPVSRIGALLARTDSSYNAYYRSLLNVIGVPTSQVIVDRTDPYSTSAGRTLTGHAATVKDPTLAGARRNACF